jgi:hypothetical protein
MYVRAKAPCTKACGRHCLGRAGQNHLFVICTYMYVRAKGSVHQGMREALFGQGWPKPLICHMYVYVLSVLKGSMHQGMREILFGQGWPKSYSCHMRVYVCMVYMYVWCICMYGVCIWYIWQGLYHTYGHIRCEGTALTNHCKGHCLQSFRLKIMNHPYF